MLSKIIELALKNKITVLVLFGALFLWGLTGLKDLPIDAVPDITNVQVVINAKTGVLDPAKIEMLVTKVIEIELSSIPKITDMRSISKFGLSQVTLIFEEGVDLYWARQQVAEKLPSLLSQVPSGISVELGPMSTGLGEVMMYVLEADSTSALLKKNEVDRLMELRLIQERVIRPTLKRVAGVADVDTNGGYQKQIHINFFPQKLEKFGLTFNQLLSRLQSVGENFGGGYIQHQNEQIIIRTSPELMQLESLQNYSLGLTPGGQNIRLKDIAEVREDYALRLGGATYQGSQTILGTVLMRVGANGRAVVEHVEEKLKELKLPTGIKLTPLYSRKFLVDNTIHTVTKSLLEGALLVIGILLIFLGNFRAALIVALAIPLSMMVAVRLMMIFGLTGNLMSLGAIDFGLLVDGSVVMVETILAHMSLKNASKDKKDSFILSTATNVVNPIVMGLLMIMVVYFPILTLEGVEGKMFRPMALTVLFALAASLVVAVVLMPVLASLFLKPTDDLHNDPKLIVFLKKKYQVLLAKIIPHPRLLAMGALSCILLAGIIVSQLGSDFIPKLDEGDAVLGVTRSANIGIDKSISEQQELEQKLKHFPEITSVFSRLGTPESATDPMGPNLADTFLILEKDHSKWRFKTKNELLEKIQEAIAVDNVEVSTTQPIEMRFNEMLEGSRADVSLRLYGEDLQTLYDKIEEAKTVLSPLKGVGDLEQDPLTALRRGPVMDIIPSDEGLGRYGILLETFNRSVGLAMGGEQVGRFYTKAWSLPIMLHLDESLREDPDQIRKLPIELPQGGTIPLDKIAEIKISDQITTIARSWGQRYAALSINLQGRDIGGFVKEAQATVKEKISLTKDYTWSWGGQFKNLERANAKLAVIVPLTLLVIFIFLLRSFNSLSYALLLFSSVPFAVVGGVFSLALRGMPLSVSAGVGFIALIGIAILNSLVLMNVFEHQEHSENVLKDIVEGASSRLRPVLTTALVASLGFIPMALNTGIGSEVQRPLATVVIGGLFTSTLLTLFLLPSWYGWLTRFKKGI